MFSSRGGLSCAQRVSPPPRLRSSVSPLASRPSAASLPSWLHTWQADRVKPGIETLLPQKEKTMEQPRIVSHDEWLAARKALLVKEKAHTREGDAISADRRRLPMVKVDAQ